jgi:hypothetical protein
MKMDDIEHSQPLRKTGLLSEAAANVSWQFMLLKDEPSDERHRAAQIEANRVCKALEAASEVVNASAEKPTNEQLFGQGTKRRLIEDRQTIGPVVTRIVEFLPKIRQTVDLAALSRDQTQFLQSEFAALSLVLQDRDL